LGQKERLNSGSVGANVERIEPTPAQRRALETDGVVCVLAGAGSGKTFVLTQKFIRLLESGVAPSEILALTFTEKAACEMKRRILDETEGLVDPVEIELASISTFHAFCATLLRQNALELGLDPAFAVVSEVESRALAYQVLDALLADWRRDARRAFALDLVFDRLFYEMSEEPTQEFRERIISLWQELRSTGDISEILKGRFGSTDWWDSLFGISELESGDVAKLVPEGLDPGKAVELEGILRDVRSLGSARSSRGRPLVEGAEIFGRLDGLAGSLSFRGRDGEANYRAAALLFRLKGWLLSSAFGVLADLIEEFDSRLEERKRTLGVADFSDLQCWVHAKLRGDERFRKRVAGRFKHILVDELQDTSPIQMKILSELAGLMGAGPQLFGVGDFGQSIYRFRYAEPELFRRFAEVAEASGKKIPLDTNFRSRQQILDWVRLVVNSYFEFLKEKKARDKCWDSAEIEAYRSFFQVEMEAHRGVADAASLPVEILLVDRSGEGGDEGFAELEAEVVANRIESLVADGGAGYGDVAVLFRKRDSMIPYRRVFERRGIPFAELAGSGFFETAEVRDVYHLMRLLDNPYDRFDLACVLNSPLVGGGSVLRGGTAAEEDYGLSASGLLMLFTAAARRGEEPFDVIMSRGWPRDVSESDAAKLERFVEMWRESESRVGVVAPERIVMWMLRRSGYWRLASQDNVRRTRNLKKLFSLLEGLQVFEGRSMTALWRALAEFIEVGASEDMASIPSEGGDAVRFMTIHSAKGLEFPVVVLARTDAGVGGAGGGKLSLFPEVGGSRSEPSDFLGVKGVEWKVAPQMGFNRLFNLKGFRKVSTQVAEFFDDFITREGLKDVLETLRLLYVAMTRAKDKLIIAGALGEKRPAFNVFLGMIFPALDLQLGGEGAGIREWLGSGAKHADITNDSGDVIGVVERFGSEDMGVRGREVGKPQRAAEAKDEAAEGEARLLPMAGSRIISLTQLDRFTECPRRYFWERITDGLGSEKESAGGGMEYGLLFHRAAASWAQARFDEGGLSGVIEVLVRELGVEDAHVKGRLEDEMGRLASSRVGELVRDVGVRLLVERDFSLALNGYILHGRPDLVAFDSSSGRVQVVDYKTDRVDSASVEAHARGYRLQMLGYLLAASRLFAGADVHACLYFSVPGAVYNGFAIDGAEGELSAALNEFAAAFGTGRFEPKPSPRVCERCSHPQKDECRR